MAKSLVEQLKEVEEKIQKYTEERKELKAKIKQAKKREEEKNLKKMGELLKNMGFTNPKEVEEFLKENMKQENINTEQ